MQPKEILFRDLILNTRPVKLYGVLALIGAALIGSGFLWSALLGGSVNYPAILTVAGYVFFMFLRVYISRNYPLARERLRSAPDGEARAVMSGGNGWGIAAFGVLALVYYVSWRALSGWWGGSRVTNVA